MEDRGDYAVLHLWHPLHKLLPYLEPYGKGLKVAWRGMVAWHSRTSRQLDGRLFLTDINVCNKLINTRTELIHSHGA